MLLLINPCDESEKFIPVLNDCFMDLKKLAQAMANESTRKAALNEFVYKLKCLEKELYLVSHKLKEAFKKNDNLKKELETEKEKCRKKATRIHELEGQLASVEFKLKVRNANSKPKPTKDASVQPDYNVEGSMDLFSTMKNLRITALATLNSIRSLIIGQTPIKVISQDKIAAEAAEVQPSMVYLQGQKDLGETILNLQNENVQLHKVIVNKDKLLKDLCTVTAPTTKNIENKASKLKIVDVTELTSDVSDIDFRDFSDSCADEEDDEKSKWDDPDFPVKLLQSMQRSVKELKNNNFGIDCSVDCKNKMAAVLDMMEGRKAKIKQKIDAYFDHPM